MRVKFRILNLPCDIETFRLQVENLLPFTCKLSYQNRSTSDIAYFIIEDIGRKSRAELLDMVDSTINRMYNNVIILPNFK